MVNEEHKFPPTSVVWPLISHYFRHLTVKMLRRTPEAYFFFTTEKRITWCESTINRPQTLATIIHDTRGSMDSHLPRLSTNQKTRN